MPHLTLDHSANLGEDADLPTLCARLARVLVDWREDGKPVYPIGGVRVRTIAAQAWCIGDGSLADAAYVHASLKVGTGRSAATLQATGQALFQVMKEHFATMFEERPLALSLELGEFSETGTFKHNNLHARFRKH
jgi:5-carboxymethyl-2-hydroxymuconate isomerase